ncbi:MAG TPA: methyl-accepting chemotaxis protein [Humidesulfovibrio sp.]|uniref:methyl-accepting chemotaxis protein n=1 Tax=Humidesulfovibrio sp. TaxID=2910988 RepID=UPI002B977913|nr:methyl-accepting chemotaxis protein [Humidesulfovibrio sp.]HWR03039.1 methyl-accepting chemotaxis protein [Humidesulfovibrio sp.]
MKSQQQIPPAAGMWAIGAVGAVLVLGAFFTANLYASLGLAAICLGLAGYLASTQSNVAAQLMGGLMRVMARKRDFLFDEVKSWREYGELGALASEAFEYNMRRREFYRGAVHAVGTPFLLCDATGIITHVSESMLDLLKKKEADVQGKTVSEAFYNKKNASITEKVIAEKKDVSQELELVFWDGRKADVLAVVNCIRGIGGEVLGAVVCLADLAEVKEQSRALQKQQEQAMQVGNAINDLAQRVASASEELSASADEQAKGANRQKAQTESVSTAMEQMTATVLEVAQNATQSSDAAATASKAAGDGVTLVRDSVKGINQVAESSRKLAQVLGQLDSQAAEIDRIINVINDIADQTNLLALNAAIEAARAGDAGRGFAVVADEVRKLAEKTMTATKEVENSIREIQERSQNAVTTMRETEKQVESSTDLSNRTGLALEEIMKRIDDVTGRVAQIATAAEEQSSAAEEINRNIEDIAGIAKEAEEGAGQSASATRELAELAQNLLQLSMTFSATKSDASKLRASQGQMKGILPKIMLDFIQSKYGASVHAKVAEALGNPMFLPGSSYPDQVLKQMADVVAQAVGQDQRAVFVDLGRYTIHQFHKMYRGYFKADNLKTFLLTMNQTHAELTKALPGIVPPRFSFEDRGNKLTMIYKSRRGYQHYFEGILRGAAEFYKTPVDVTVQIQDAETARADITFR